MFKYFTANKHPAVVNKFGLKIKEAAYSFDEMFSKMAEQEEEFTRYISESANTTRTATTPTTPTTSTTPTTPPYIENDFNEDQQNLPQQNQDQQNQQDIQQQNQQQTPKPNNPLSSGSNVAGSPTRSDFDLSNISDDELLELFYKKDIPREKINDTYWMHGKKIKKIF